MAGNQTMVGVGVSVGGRGVGVGVGGGGVGAAQAVKNHRQAASSNMREAWRKEVLEAKKFIDDTELLKSGQIAEVETRRLMYN